MEIPSSPKIRIKAFDLDFNWGKGGPNGFAAPGLWADADPKDHIQFYQQMHVNTIQTFCVSCNGYAWYKDSEVAPPQPGLKTDFLNDLTLLGHESNMQVMGYFCIGANTRWGEEHPDLSHGTPAKWHIPYTDEYLKYIKDAIRDVLLKTEIDGFMIDWIFHVDPTWMPCEIQLYEQLFAEPFPGKSEISADKILEYHRKAIARMWDVIYSAARSIKNDCIIWLSCHDITNPTLEKQKIFDQIDWVMNEDPNSDYLKQVGKIVGDHVDILQCLCGWGSRHNAKKLIKNWEWDNSIGFYGFAKPGKNSLPPRFEKNQKRPLWR